MIGMEIFSKLEEARPPQLLDGGKAFMRLIENEKPFTIPKELREILTSMTLEYGTGLGVAEILPATHFWSITLNEITAGYAWTVAPLESNSAELFIDIAVLPQHRRCGIASFALSQIELQLANKQIPALYAQVNSNNKDTGLWVRQWLLRHKFTLLRRDIFEGFSMLSDEDLVVQYPCPIYFSKSLIAKAVST